MKKGSKGLIVVVTVSLILTLTACSRPSRQPKPKKEPLLSLLLVSLDTLRADRLGCYGNPRHTSPWLDYYSKKGTLFVNTFSQACLTTPSHMTLFTSLYPPVHNVSCKRILNENTPLLAEILQQNGFRTSAVTGGVTIRKDFGFNRGFEVYGEKDPLESDWDLSSIDNEILPWLADRFSHNERFFYFFHTFRIHDPYLPPAPLHRIFNEDYTGTMFSHSGDYSASLSSSPDSKKRNPFWNMFNKESDEDLEQLIVLYDGEIRYTDHAIGYLLRNVLSLDRKKKLMVAIISDHGEEFKEHGGFLHTTVYDETLHVPFLFLHPHRNETALRSELIEKMVGLVDITPTLLNFLKIDISAPFQGTDGMDEKREPSGERAIYSSKYNLREAKSSLRTDSFKYIINNRTAEKELYNLRTDPKEQHNLFMSDQYPLEKESLSSAVAAQQAENEVLMRKYGANKRLKINSDTRKKLKALGYGVGDELEPW